MTYDRRMTRGSGNIARLRHAGRGRVQALLGRAGWEIRPTTTDADQRRSRLLAAEGIDLVLDVGANVGQYGMRLRANGYRGRIVSFEPYETAYAQLQRTADRDALWDAHRLALSDEEGVAELNISSNSFSSSLLALTDRHVESAPGSSYVATESVRARRLDAIWPEVVGTARPWLKLDVQGFEMHVLRGAGERLGEARALQIELSLEPLYTGAVGWRDTVDWLEERGFALVAVEPGFDDPATGRMLQFDGFFVRTDG